MKQITYCVIKNARTRGRVRAYCFARGDTNLAEKHKPEVYGGPHQHSYFPNAVTTATYPTRRVVTFTHNGI